MEETTLTFDAGLAGLEGDAWLDQLEDVVDDLGYFEPLGPDHQVVFLKAGPKLLVTFEDMETILKDPTAEPRSFAFARREGWSVLTFIAHRPSWFRHVAIYQFVDGLVDDGFFDGFDDVLFHGVGGGGYAAAAYSVASPGANVLALRPQATLDAALTGWDRRFVSERKHDFTDRYGYAPDMIEAARKVYVVHAPLSRADAIHAAILTRNHVDHLRLHGLAGRVEDAVDAIGIHDEMIRGAMDGTLNPVRFARMRRPLRNYVGYRRGLTKAAMDSGHRQLAANAAAHLLEQVHDPWLTQRLAELSKAGFAPRAPRRRARPEVVR